MPQIKLEYTSNIIEKNFTELFEQLHEILVATLPTKMDACKSRAIKLDNYLVGYGGASTAFVYCSIRVLPGRTDEVLAKAMQQAQALLAKHFSESLTVLDMQISVEVSNLSSHYSKFTA